MKKILLLIVALLTFLTALPAQAEGKKRIFLFVGEPNVTAWKMVIENPADREASMSKVIAKLGGEMLSYYWGLGDGKNYITIALPDDNELIQAVYVTRLGDDLLKSYKAIEVISSKDMTSALKQVKGLKAIETGAEVK